MALIAGDDIRLKLFSSSPPRAPPEEGDLHIRVVSHLGRGTQRTPPCGGIAVAAATIQPGGRAHLHMVAASAAPARATHGPHAPEDAPARQSQQAAAQAGIRAGLLCAEHAQRAMHRTIVISSGNTTAVAQVVARATGRGDVSHRPWMSTSADPRRKKRPLGADAPRVTDLDKLQSANARLLCSLLAKWGPGSVRLRAEEDAPDLALCARAAEAAKRKSLHATVWRRSTQSSALWEDSRIWDPGD